MVIAGKDAGKESRITRVIPDKGKVLVEGVNTAKRHQPATGRDHAGRDHRQGHAHRRLQRDDHLREVRSDPDRARIDDKGKKHRICVKCGGDL